MKSNQFLWGLSNGAIVLAIAGTFWLGLGMGQPAARAGWLAWWAFVVLWITPSAVILLAAVRLRRRSGFKSSELNQVDGRQQTETRKIQRSLVWVVLAQTLVVGVAVLCCVWVKRQDLIWPAIGLVVSLHFAPLGRVFHVRAYYALALVGSGVSLVALVQPTGPHAHVLFCSAMALIMWAFAVYLIRNADRIAEKAAREVWAGNEKRGHI